MTTGTLEIRWRDAEAKDWIDLLPFDTFASTGAKPELEHEVRGPRGGSHSAKCHLTVTSTTADLDYTAFAPFNIGRDMTLGVMRLHFVDADRTSIARAEWKDAGAAKFTPADVEFGPFKLKPQRPYEPGLATAVKSIRMVRERPGQRSFRTQLKMAYGNRCCITGCAVSATLDGAHIDPYRGTDSDHPQNGLLLRRDLHALFDAGLLAVHPASRTVAFAKTALSWPDYAGLQGKRLREPDAPNSSYRPSRQALRRRWDRFLSSSRTRAS